MRTVEKAEISIVRRSVYSTTGRYSKQLEMKNKQLSEKEKQIDLLDRDHNRRGDRESLRVARHFNTAGNWMSTFTSHVSY